MRADLHTHSTASDGLLAPADLVLEATRRGLAVLGLTDHDTTRGVAEAIEAGHRLGLRIIPGVELSTVVAQGEVHLLGYGIDAGSPILQETLASLRSARLTRLTRIVDRLRELGYPLDEAQIRPDDGEASAGRPHVARAMIAAGYVASVSEAFERFLSRGRPAYVASEKLLPADAVRLIRQAGGVPVHAHPCSSPDFPASLPDLLEAGLEGIEVYYGEYDDERRAALAGIAREHGLLATGGSDYHGEGFREGRTLGSVDLPDEALQRFLERLEAAPHTTIDADS